MPSLRLYSKNRSECGAHVKQPKIYSCNSSRNAFTCRHWFAFTQFMRTQEEVKKEVKMKRKTTKANAKKKLLVRRGRKWNSFRLLIMPVAYCLLFVLRCRMFLAANGQHFDCWFHHFWLPTATAIHVGLNRTSQELVTVERRERCEWQQ